MNDTFFIPSEKVIHNTMNQLHQHFLGDLRLSYFDYSHKIAADAGHLGSDCFPTIMTSSEQAEYKYFPRGPVQMGLEWIGRKGNSIQ